MGDDVRRTQHSVVSCKVGIAGERNVIAQTGRTSASRVHAVFRHASRYYEARDPPFFKLLLEHGFEEGIRFPFPDDWFAVQWLYGWMNLPAVGLSFQRMTLWPVVLDVNHRRSRRACSG